MFPQTQLKAEDVLSERIRLESISTAIGASGVMAIACVMYFIFPDDLVHGDYLGLWLVAQLVVGTIWLAFIYKHKQQATPITLKLWPYCSTIVCSFYGLIWGAGWVFFISDTNAYQIKAAVIFTITLGGVFTGGVLATLFHLPSLLSFTLCSLLPPLISSFIHAGIFHNWFGLSLCVYMLACAAFALNLHRFLLETLEQREDKKRLAQQLEEEKQRVERISQDKTRFLAAASHDLRQPLQALQFFHQALKDTPNQALETQPFIAGMETSLSALKSLLNGMLDIAQLDEGQQSVHKQVFPLNALFRRIHQQYEPLAAEAGIEFYYKSNHYWVESDPLLIERIIQNLVHNAIKHMGKTGRILLGVKRHQNNICIQVRDNGIGIPRAEQEAIFKEFYQLHNPARQRSQGVGLGLSIVKRLSQLLGHNLSLWSQEDQGCIFKLDVPLVANSVINLNATKNPAASNAACAKMKGKILVIEDDEQVLEALNLLLQLWGYEVVITANPEPQTLMNEHASFDFIISDYQLGSTKTGIDIIQQLRLLSQHPIPALLLTGNTSPALLEQLQEIDIAVSYKPINPLQVKNIIIAAN
ncbi:ATP-binding protein [uncultured Thiothrix sp.]|uniref:ATP-binding response regulator n=1 Tax=uncultured Thiothrix sp. TaxID=223185 RepID=UPI002639321D|nr:ATP-binding protein [uncultured Thiothrix sp.]